MKKRTYEQLREVLLGLGYAENAQRKQHVTFRKPGQRLYIILPWMRPHAVVEPIHLLSVRKVLAHDGAVPEDGFDSLFEMQPH